MNSRKIIHSLAAMIACLALVSISKAQGQREKLVPLRCQANVFCWMDTASRKAIAPWKPLLWVEGGITGRISSDDIPHPRQVGTISAFPNPTQGRVGIRLEGMLQGSAIVRVYDPQGNVVLQQVFAPGQEITLDLPPANGLYLVEVVANDRHRHVAKVLRME